MTTFVPLNTTPYKKSAMPVDDRSRLDYLDQQLRSLEKSIKLLTDAVSQLQDEVTLIWTSNGHTRP